MIKYNKQHGFSLIELLIVMGLLAIIAVMTMDAFTMVLKQSSQTMKTVTTEIDQTIGFDILRSDIEQAGFGLPWTFKNSITYAEAASSPASTYNDSPSNAPRAILSGNNVGYNSSDYLVIKSTLVGENEAAKKWTYISKDTSTAPTPKPWTPVSSGDRVIVIKPLYDATGNNELVMDSGTFYTTYSSSSFASAFSPATLQERFIIYGVDADTNLRMPFNRADYYLARPSTGMPSDCAPNTGILYKATVNHGDGALITPPMPILDCVADMQVVFRLGTGLSPSDDITASTALTAKQIREQVKEVRVYILFHEGSLDRAYTHGASTVTVGEGGNGSTFNLAATIGTDWNRYRWRVITLAVKPKNLL